MLVLNLFVFCFCLFSSVNEKGIFLHDIQVIIECSDIPSCFLSF